VCGRPHSTGLWQHREMENGLGPIDQLGSVVDEISGARTQWVERLRVGPLRGQGFLGSFKHAESEE
jgi:hypothetical protein